MTPLTLEWVEKAEGDLTTARRELRARKSPNYDAACFHSQQCAEKYLKALLQEAATSFPKTHDLVMLLELWLPSDPQWEMMRPALRLLGGYAVYIRYPGDSADKAMAREAVTLAQQIRQMARRNLGLLPQP
jgi:HEPN domain-containing protein